MPNPIARNRSCSTIVNVALAVDRGSGPRRRRLVACVLLVLACAPGLQTSEGVEDDSRVVVLIRNDSFSDVRVLAIVGEGNRVRLGMVGALSRRALILPFTVPASAGLQLIAEPLAAGDVHSTEPIRTSQGDTIEWVLANHVEISRWFIR